MSIDSSFFGRQVNSSYILISSLLLLLCVPHISKFDNVVGLPGLGKKAKKRKKIKFWSIMQWFRKQVKHECIRSSFLSSLFVQKLVLESQGTRLKKQTGPTSQSGCPNVIICLR